MKKTVLHDRHVSLKAKMGPFGGYEMPIYYESGILKEHTAARMEAALFDTCHMGEFKVSGGGAIVCLEKILSCDVADIKIGGCRYGFLCSDAGGIIDDLIVYRIAEDEFMMVTNASNEEKVSEQLAAHIVSGARFENISQATAKIDVQGPKAPKIVAGLMREPIDGIKFYNFAKNYYRGAEVIVSRTGYTGEIGFEVYCSIEAAGDFWDDCVAGGAVPAGLGARDTLRLEMGFPLYGHELCGERNAAQSDFSRAISKKKPFIGSERVLDPAAAHQVLRGIALDGRRTAHQGDMVTDVSGAEAGVVTSGGYSPTLGHAIALAYINREYAEIDTPLKVTSGKNEFLGKICSLPFYKNATARADILLYL